MRILKRCSRKFFVPLRHFAHHSNLDANRVGIESLTGNSSSFS